MWLDGVSSSGPLTLESDVLWTALCSPAEFAINPIALRKAKTPWSFGLFECKRVTKVFSLRATNSFFEDKGDKNENCRVA